MAFFDSPRPLVFAHRGGCALGPENTCAAFDLGLAAGADGLELDVHLSADGIPVVHHDDTLDRTTSSTGPIRARTAAELALVDAGCRFVSAEGTRPFSTAATTGPGAASAAVGAPLAGISTLLDVLRRYPGIPIIVEMKVDSEAMAHAVADAVRAAGAVDRVCGAGYGANSLGTLRRLLPSLATSAGHSEVRLALYRSWLRVPAARAPYGGYQVPEHAGMLRVVSPRFVRDAHRAGLKVQVWTVDDERDMERLLAWGVDALITNRPDLAVGVRDAFVAAGRRD